MAISGEAVGCRRTYSPWCRVAWRTALWVLTLSPGIALCDFDPNIEKDREEFYRELSEGGHTHLGRGLLDRALEGYDGLREKAKDRLGLDWLVAYSYLYQRRSHGCNWANRNTRGCEKWTNNSELDFLARWDLVDSERFDHCSSSRTPPKSPWVGHPPTGMAIEGSLLNGITPSVSPMRLPLHPRTTLLNGL